MCRELPVLIRTLGLRIVPCALLCLIGVVPPSLADCPVPGVAPHIAATLRTYDEGGNGLVDITQNAIDWISTEYDGIVQSEAVTSPDNPVGRAVDTSCKTLQQLSRSRR